MNNEGEPIRPSGIIALAGFWLLGEVLSFLLCAGAGPDFYVHPVHLHDNPYLIPYISPWLGIAGTAVIMFAATITIAICENRLNKKLLPQAAGILFGLWVMALFVVIYTPIVMRHD